MGVVSLVNTGEWTKPVTFCSNRNAQGALTLLLGALMAQSVAPFSTLPSGPHLLSTRSHGRSAAYTDTHLAKERSSSSCTNHPSPLCVLSPPLLGRKQSTVDLASQITWLDEPPFPAPQDTATCEYPCAILEK